MKRHSLSGFLVVVLAFILSAITASAQQPRAVPPNDNLNSPTAILIGKKYKVPDIGAATNQIGEPLASCTAGYIPHSVWFSVNLPEYARVYLSTFGTLLVTPNSHSIDTVLAVYEQTSPGVLEERACADNTNGVSAALTFNASKGITYYIAAGTASGDSMSPESVLKLSSRVIITTWSPPNPSFETPVNGAGWKVTNSAGDQTVCSDSAYPALAGLCAFRFTGTPGIMTKLTQTIAFPAYFKPRKNAVMSYRFFFRVLDTAALGKAKVKFIVKYRDGTPPSSHTINLTGLAAMTSYDDRYFSLVLKSSKVASIKLMVKFGSPTGTLLVDSFLFYYDADAMTRSDGLLPVPPAAQ